MIAVAKKSSEKRQIFLKCQLYTLSKKNIQIFCLFHVQYYVVFKLLKFGDPVIILSASNWCWMGRCLNFLRGLNLNGEYL